MKMMKKLYIVLGMTLLLFTSNAYQVDAYYYSYYEEAIASAPGMIVKRVLTNEDLTMRYLDIDYPINMVNPVDLFVYNDHMYIVDSELNKILVLDSNYDVVFEYPSSVEVHPKHSDKLDADLLLNRPRGIHVNASSILIADTENGRLIEFDHYFNIIGTYGRPSDATFEDSNIDYRPQKISRDSAGRMFIVAQGIYEGIIELDPDGSFNRYTGVNNVAISPLDIFWMRFMTDAQRDQMRLQLPPSFVNLHMDAQNFIFAIANPSSTYTGDGMIKRINPKGLDVLRTQGYFQPKGDVQFVHGAEVVESGPSNLVDITVNHFGAYSVLDQKRGRIFTYDSEGNLLYITGEKGNQSGMFSNPRSLDYLQDDLVVVDAGNRSIIVFELTEFGSLVNEATMQYQQGLYDESAITWEKVLKHNTNYYLAYRGIGRTLLRNGEYEEAMEHFLLANDTINYSIAYKEYRNQRLETYFPIIMVAISGTIFYLFYTSIKANIRLNKDVGRDD
ncbi:hypothetical protein [Liberiplasma polymorphum]|uniref:hypothetical protein n=1 Tax=Liberiplasma polymorphum TaxID=3374570 RepID=UPI0037759983